MSLKYSDSVRVWGFYFLGGVFFFFLNVHSVCFG